MTARSEGQILPAGRPFRKIWLMRVGEMHRMCP